MNSDTPIGAGLHADETPRSRAAAPNAARTSPSPCTGLSPARWITREGPGSPSSLTRSPPPARGSCRVRCADRDRDDNPLPGRRLLPVGGGGRDRHAALGHLLDDHPHHLADVTESLLARSAP